MKLNKSKGNMYGFVDATTNFIKGMCPHNCSYCYMKRWWPNMSAPRLDEKEFTGKAHEGFTIFVGSSIDMFAQRIPREWIIEILEYLNNFNNTYLLQSKNPEGFSGLQFPEKTILCTTIETNRIPTKKILGNCYTPENRMLDFLGIYHRRKMITIEPVMDFDLDTFVKWMININPIQINIGADSGGNNLPEPSKEKLQEFIQVLKQNNLTVHEKPNLKRLMK